MTWLLLTLSCIILWGITDILLKKSLDYSDSLSQYKSRRSCPAPKTDAE